MVRDEIIEFVKSMHSLILGFLSSATAAAVLLTNDQIISSAKARASISFGLSQVLFLLGIYLAMLLSNMSTHARYSSWLERRMNVIAGQDIASWETRCVAVELSRPCTAFGFSTVIFGLFMVAVNVFLIANSRGLFNNGRLIWCIGLGELFLLLAALAAVRAQSSQPFDPPCDD